MNADIGLENYELIREFWLNNENIKIQENQLISNNRCIIYASSNGIWNPNTIERFNKSIRLDDRYEWKKFGGGAKL